MSTSFIYFTHGITSILTLTSILGQAEPTILSLDEFPKKAICNGLSSASERIDNISLQKCIDYCQDLSLSECKMINYFNYRKTNDDSRCYIFNELCEMSMDLENSINSSQVWYKNEFTQEYCIDYRDYFDDVGDSCQHYTDYGWCSNNEINDKSNIDEFEQLRSDFTATEACCNCGGGKLVVDGISISYINNITTHSSECSFKEEEDNMTNIRKWNNFAAFDLTQYINQHLTSTSEYNSDLLVYTEFKPETVVNNYPPITICDFKGYQDNPNMTNDFFILMTINYNNAFNLLLLNSEFFNIDEYILSQMPHVSHYEDCLQLIQTSASINGIMPCWNQYTRPTPQPTNQPIQSPETVEVNTKGEFKLEIPIYAYFIIFGACVICMIANLMGREQMKTKDKGEGSEIIELETKKYSDDHFAIHSMKKIEKIVATSTSFLISASNVIDDEVLFDERKALIQPGSEGYLEEFIEMKSNISGQKQAGKLIVQKAYYEEKQMKYINDEFSKKVHGECAYMLFGDNDVDRERSDRIKRKHFGGQARIMGEYDRKFAYGIITTFYNKKTPNLEQFKSVIDALFIPLQNHLKCGYDVVYTYPSQQDLITHRDRYYSDGKQIIYHNIGTGTASFYLTINHVKYIQFKLQQLQTFASQRIIVDYYHLNPTKNKNFIVYNARQNDNIQVVIEKKTNHFCPSCGLEKHYLIQFKNCNHRMCEQCLRGYLIYDMRYDQDTDRDRFRCYAQYLNKCEGHLCMNDVIYAMDRCQCEECLKNNTDSGNGTILSDDNYTQFENILASFDVKVKIWKKDICSNRNCQKPFVVKKPYEMIESKVSQQSIEIIINDNRKELHHCNCCGKDRVTYNLYNLTDVLEEEKEIHKIQTNICVVCNFWNCDECTSNCFYKVDTNFTQEPAKQILNAFIIYNQNQVKKNDYESKMVDEFEICEMCWYNYYCHICPYCNYIFCGECGIKWEGNTRNWLDSNETNGIIKKSHDKSSKHKCIKQKEKLEKQEVHKSYIRINQHREKLDKINLESQKKSQDIFKREAENFKLKQKIQNMENKMVELKMENQQKENMVLSKHLSIATKQKEEVEEKLRESKYRMVWQWLDGNSTWNAYNKVLIDNIERLKIGQTYKYTFSGNKQTYIIHKLSMDKAEQTNVKSKKKRNLRRIKMEKNMHGIIYPDFWQYYVSDMEQKEGGGVDDDYTTPKLIELDLKNDEIAQRVSNRFFSTANKKNKIIKIESVQNRYLWDKYFTQKESMKKSIGLGKLNEKSLWHGTHVNIIDKIIKQGFRKEFNSVHHYGEGTYFACNASYSSKYCQSNNNVFQMFECLVLCGESAVGGKNITLRNWPIKTDASGQIYDSLVNKKKHPAIFVIHDDVRVYPMFIVHFTKG